MNNLLNVLKEVCIIVDALDRIGSNAKSSEEDMYLTIYYMFEQKVFSRLIGIRKDLLNSLISNKREERELEEKLEVEVNYWELPVFKSIEELKAIVLDFYNDGMSQKQ